MSERISRKHLLGFAASFGLFTSLGNQSARADSSAGVVGAWTLVSFNVDEGKTTETPRFGPNPAGYLLYTTSGRMAAVLAGTHRPALAPPSSLGAGAQGECVKAVGDFLAYAGSYEIRGNRVLHHVEVSVFTNLVGTTLERQFSIAGDTLTIRTLPPEIWGSSNVLVWKRA